MITWLKECRCWEVQHEDGGDVGGWRWLLVKEMHGCWCKRLVLVKARVAGEWFSDEEEIWEG
ncbi:hypothetical protein NC652_008167 [Populus alba x Populus x berolinensis]|nr:hypothetical protein NC652_008167 [Populus alba x Populus x berolinensis]